MLAAANLALGGLFAPNFRSLLLRSTGLTLGLLLAVMAVLRVLYATFVVPPEWVDGILQVFGNSGLLIGSVLLVAPITALIAGFFF
jgi:CysZ protein